LNETLRWILALLVLFCPPARWSSRCRDWSPAVPVMPV